jgi:hypothetical protein
MECVLQALEECSLTSNQEKDWLISTIVASAFREIKTTYSIIFNTATLMLTL